MGQPRFVLRDSRHKNQNSAAAKVQAAFERAGFLKMNLNSPSDLDSCDVLVVHERTDAPGPQTVLSDHDINTLLENGGVYIEYTTASASWEKRGERQYFGNHTKLIDLVSGLLHPASTDDLNSVLRRVSIEFDNLATLSILCQAYLALHGGNELEGWKNLGEELRRQLLSSRKQELVEDREWWRGVLSGEDEGGGDWKRKLKQEADKQARLNSLPEDAEMIDRFIAALKEETEDFSGLVMSTYQATRRLLEGR